MDARLRAAPIFDDVELPRRVVVDGAADGRRPVARHVVQRPRRVGREIPCGLGARLHRREVRRVVRPHLMTVGIAVRALVAVERVVAVADPRGARHRLLVERLIRGALPIARRAAVPANEQDRPRARGKRDAAHARGPGEIRILNVGIAEGLMLGGIADEQRRGLRATPQRGRVEHARGRAVATARDDRNAALPGEHRPAEQRTPLGGDDAHIPAEQARPIAAHAIRAGETADRRSREMRRGSGARAVIGRIGRGDESPAPPKRPADVLPVRVGRVDLGEVRHSDARVHDRGRAAEGRDGDARETRVVDAAEIERRAIGAQPERPAAVGETRHGIRAARAVGGRHREAAQIGQIGRLHERPRARVGLRPRRRYRQR